MKIRETFGTTIQKIIEPVVKVSERRPNILLDELRTLVITPQWERHIHQILQEYTDALDNEEEQGIGIWISGFFGSGKSLLMKTLGTLLEGGELEGEPVHEIFLKRLLDDTPERADIRRFLALCQRNLTCTAIGGNMHAQIASNEDTLTQVTFRLFAQARGYTHMLPFAWAVEYQLDERGLLGEFQRVASERCHDEWSAIAEYPEFYSAQLYEAAAQVYPDHFSSPTAVEQAADSAQRNGITPEMLIKRLRNWCRGRDAAGKRHKLLLQFDELGQWLQGQDRRGRIMQVQALVESASTYGDGRIWIAVTAHGDVQALRQDVLQEDYNKINQRFKAKCKLSNEDINTVVQERVLRKTATAMDLLQKHFEQQSGVLSDLGAVKETKRNYPLPDSENFALFYPYLPWTVAAIPDITKGIAQAAGRGDELTGANRTMIGVVQGGILTTDNVLESQVGKLICLADLYRQFDLDIPLETRNDLKRLREATPGGNDNTVQVAYALYLLGKAEHIPCNLENVVRALITSTDTNLAALRPMVKTELEKLVKAGYAKQVGEIYVFLSTQQRSFQEKIQNRQSELSSRTSDLIAKLRDFGDEEPLRFDRVSLTGHEKLLRIVLDGSNLRGGDRAVTIQVYSPLQCLIAPELTNDEEIKQRSQREQNTFFLRMANVPELRTLLAQLMATEEIIELVMRGGQDGNPEYDVARQAKQHDVAEYRRSVVYALGRAVREGLLFFRGTPYYLRDGNNAVEAVRNALSQLLPLIYARFSDLPYRILKEERAVKAALEGKTADSDLEGLKVYKKDGTLNEGNPLLSTLRSRIPLEKDGTGPVSADLLRQELDQPPFGWDLSCVKVGLALLLRASACHLIDGGTTYTDPSRPEVLLMLTKEQRFKSVRVLGLRPDLSIPELQEIRGYIETIFSVKPQIVMATLNDKLKEQLQLLQSQAREIENWAKTAQCPLPLAFESGSSLVAELLESNAANVRLPHFMREWETVLNYQKLTRELLQFKAEHGSAYVEGRNFFTSMVNVDNPPEDIYSFLQYWRALEKERTATDAARWSSLLQSYYTARQALTDQIAALQQAAQQELATLEEALPQRVQSAGIPNAEIEGVIAELSQLFAPLRARTAQIPVTLSDAKALKSALMNQRLTLSSKLREIQERYQPADAEQAQPQEIQMTWRNLLGTRRISSPADLQKIIDTLQRYVYPELEQQHTVIIE